MRSFKPGDEVLAILPHWSNSLEAKFFGPYKVLQLLGPVDYWIDTPGRKKIERICHVNLHKSYFRRDEEKFPRSDDSNENTIKAQPVLVAFGLIHYSNYFGSTIQALSDLKGSFASDFDLSHLTEEQQTDVRTLLTEFRDIFCNQPGHTALVSHHIEFIEGAKPVALLPYRLNPEKRTLV